MIHLAVFALAASVAEAVLHSAWDQVLWGLISSGALLRFLWEIAQRRQDGTGILVVRVYQPASEKRCRVVRIRRPR